MRRLRRASLIATLFATLLIPAVGSFAGPREQLQRKQQALNRVRDRVAENSAEAKTLTGEIDSLNSDITNLQVELNRLDVRITEVRSEIATAEARIAQTQGRIDVVEERAVAQAVELYKSGGTDTIDALLEARSISELNDKLELMGVAAKENTGALISFSRLKQQIERDHRLLFDRKEVLAATIAQQSNLKASLDAKRAQLAERLGKVRTKLASDKHHEGELEADSRALQAEIVEFQAKASVAALGTSNQGFIWPLNGGITSGYGPRWGSMHTGIDIDGYSGQPIVAAKEGRVLMASYYSGYGNAVIIDHGGGIATLYGHMSGFNTSSGAYVDQGSVIGYVGCTGSCTGDHLHFEVRVNGSAVDPMPYLP